MEEKGKWNKLFLKIGTGVLFVISCFVAMYVLIQFHERFVMIGIAAVLLLISAFLFFTAVFSDKAQDGAVLEEVKSETSDEVDLEFRRKLTKHMKEMEAAQRELAELLKAQNTLLQGQMQTLKHELSVLSDNQTNQTKSVIKFNKENARQLAISERETLVQVMQELKKTMEDNAGAVASVNTAKETEASEEAAWTGFEALPEELLMEELPLDMEIPLSEELIDALEPEDTELPELGALESEDVVLPEPDALEPLMEELLAEPTEELLPELEDLLVPEPEVAPAKEEAPAPAADPLAGLSSSDPGAMMTPEDIAKLLEAMGN